MNRDEIVERIETIAESGDADKLLEMTVATVDSELYEAASEAFGSWDAALAATLCRAVSGGAEETRRTRSSEPSEDVIRKVGKDAREPIFVATEDNLFFKMGGLNLEVTDEPEHLATPPGSGPITHIHHVGEPKGLVVFSSRGNYFALAPSMVPKWRGENEIRRIESVLDLESGEVLEFVVPRREFYGGRIIHVTRGGKGKATDASDYMYTMDREARTAFKLKEGDRPVAVMSAPEEVGVFCASALGKGIHFPSDDLRSMGHKAIGVNVMKVSGEGDEVVGAFAGHRVANVAMITRKGYGKRVVFDEFRQQGRAGAGMQLCRLNRDDRVVGVAPCQPSSDLVITTARGRVHRLPAHHFELMGRPAKGNRMIELSDGEQIVEFTSLPCGSE